MERFRPLLFVGLFLLFGSIGLSRFSSAQVRPVDALGLFASGMGCGAAVVGFVVALTAGMKVRRQRESVVELNPNEAEQGAAADRPRE
jgi:hypothetical protein